LACARFVCHGFSPFVPFIRNMDWGMIAMRRGTKHRYSPAVSAVVDCDAPKTERRDVRHGYANQGSADGCFDAAGTSVGHECPRHVFWKPVRNAG
jgi:hypothetical protein